jgi:3-methyl-2-oxobutanoate hydroxymethyltransferase
MSVINSQITVTTLAQLKSKGEPITCLTCYDASFAKLLEIAGVEILLIGDSLGNVIQGHDSTLPVTISNMVYHSACVAKARLRALLIADMPFLSYATPKQALRNAACLLQQGGAHVVKLEGGLEQVETIRHLSNQGVAVCGHLGLLPQSVHKLGGYKVQGRSTEAASELKTTALALEEAGAKLLVLECVPATLAAEISRSLRIPVIGIGAGVDCDGQVLVLYDMLGIRATNAITPRFVKNFLIGQSSIEAAIQAYVIAVKQRQFPALEHCFT